MKDEDPKYRFQLEEPFDDTNRKFVGLFTRKGFRSLIGMGVAIMCPDGVARKFPVTRILTTETKVKTVKGFAIRTILLGVELDLRGYAYFETSFEMMGSMIRRIANDHHSYYNPNLIFQTRGDCMRAYATARLNEIHKKIAGYSENLERLAKEQAANESGLKEYQEKYNAVLSEYKTHGRKWFKDSVK